VFTKHPKVAALGAFLAGGVLVGGVTFATAAHGAGTGTPGKGLSDAEYTAAYAWGQSVKTSKPTTTLSIPTDDRLTITLANGSGSCTVTGSINGASVSYTIDPESDGLDSTWLPFSVDPGASVACSSGSVLTLAGYLVPLSVGQS
jgi:hypothetical protein